MKKSLRMLTCLLAVCLCFSTAACGPSDDPETVHIMIQNAGYGYKWVETLGEMYKERTGVTVEVNPVAIYGRVDTSSYSPTGNNTDLYINLSTGDMSNVASGRTVNGKPLHVDLSDIYDYVPEGYEKPLKELVTDAALRNCTYYEDGKQYLVEWSGSINGIIYNADLFAQNEIDIIPRTTDELMEVCEKIKGLNLTKDGETVYAFYWAKQYFTQVVFTWWAQYIGYDAYLNFLQGKNEQGVYTADIYKERGRVDAFQALEDIIGYGKGYASDNCVSYTFTQSQLKFLEGKSFMCPNGDWLEREAETNFPDTINIKFMKTPIISTIIRKLETVENDTELREVIDYVDGKIEEGDLSKTYDPEDIERVREARNMVYTQSFQDHIFIPSYSNNIDGAKDFLKFMLSKEAQQTMFDVGGGNTFAYKYSEIGIDTSKGSPLQQSKIALGLSPDTLFIGREMHAPMFLKSGLEFFSDNEAQLATIPSSATYRNPLQLVEAQYESWVGRWGNAMNQAGVRN